VTDAAGNSAASPTNNTFAITTVGPTVALSYSSNPAGPGTETITATYSTSVTSTPNISINQPGSTDISNVAMTDSGNHQTFTYNYTVHAATGTTYIDGTATVSLSTVTDGGGNQASGPSNSTFVIDTNGPTAAITYSINHTVKSGDTQVITATFSKPMNDSPVPKIAISGSNTLSASNMTKTDSTHYYYNYIVGAGNGVATVALSVGTDAVGNVIASTPSSGATFNIDNTPPTATISAICSVDGNKCSTDGQNSNPQEPYGVQTISGTAGDEQGGSGLASVVISIKDTNINYWYNGTNFTNSSEDYLPVNGTTSWTYDASTISLAVDHVYLIDVKTIDTAGNQNVTSSTFEFANTPPVVSNVTGSENSSGVVSVTYDVTDLESSQTTNYLFYGAVSSLSGSITNNVTSLTVADASNFPSSGTILIDNEIISYTSKSSNSLQGLTRGASSSTPSIHSDGANIFIKASSATGGGIGLSDIGTGKSISWQMSDDASGYENANAILKVVANDGSSAFMIGEGNSSAVVLDAKAPTANVTFDAGIAGVTGSATINIPMPEDISSVQYRINDDAETQTTPVDTGWVSITGNTTIPWTFDSDIEVKNIEYQFRDMYGNVSPLQTISTPTPVPTSSFIVQDISNVSDTPPTYSMYISWQPSTSTDFSAYKLEYATSNDNITYTDYVSISDATFFNPSTSYYVFSNLLPQTFYRFRLGVLGTTGNISVRSNPFITTKTDGVQNFGEGGGGSVATAPVVENVVPVQGTDKNVTVTYKLTDSAISQKINPTYEGYIFYNIGITLPDNAYSNDSSSLTLSDASKLKSSGFILVNNEVIKYTGKDGNTLTGLTRGTWPDLFSSGKSTRVNSYFLSGTPVWIMANDTSPIQIDDLSGGGEDISTPPVKNQLGGDTNQLGGDTTTPPVDQSSGSISTGQTGTITWDTSNETGLLGSTYTNVSIKVLVHDNQPAVLGPLSSQNDHSEDGILNLLDLSVSSVGSTTIKSTSAVITWSTVDYSSSLVEYGTVVPGNDGEYNLSQSNGNMVLNHSIYLSHLTPNTHYYYRTTSTDVNNQSVTSVSDFTTTPGPVISNVLSSNTTDTASTITWDTDIPSSSYIEYSSNPDLSDSTTVGTDDLVTSHSISLSNLEALKNYYYRVYSLDGSGNTGEDTNEGNYYVISTLADMTPPVISNISVPIIDSDSIAVVWNTNENADGQISYGTQSGVYDHTTDISPTPPTLVLNHLIAIAGLDKQTTYYYIIKSKDANGNLATSQEQVVTTSDTQIIVQGGGIIGVLQSVYDAVLKERDDLASKLKNQDSIPPVISNIQVSDVNSFGATISFDTDKNTIGFIKYGKDINYDLTTGDDIFSMNHTIKLDGLSMGTQYNFQIKAIDQSSNVATSNNQTFQTKFLTEDLSNLQKVDNVEQFQKEIEDTIESILPSLVPPFVDKPVVSNIAEDSATIDFKTNIKAYSILDYATDADYDSTKTNPYNGEISDTTDKEVDHTLQITGLKPNTIYHIMAKAFSLPQVVGKSEDVTFSTLPSKIKASVVGIKTDSFTVVWTTDDPTSSIVQYKDLKGGTTGQVTDDTKSVSHSIQIQNLTQGTPYEIRVSGVNSLGNTVEGDQPIDISTSVDVTPPVISNFKINSALVPGTTDKIQSIVSWQTDEPSTSAVFYEEGPGSPTQALANKQEDTELSLSHTIILTTLKPGTIYRFQIASADSAGNINKLPVRTLITPSPSESIIDVIFKNFDQTFNFIKNVK
jgi:hypothetical protein